MPNGYPQTGSKTAQQQATTKPTRVAELERRLEDLTSRLDSVSRQQALRRDINVPQSVTGSVPESSGPVRQTKPLDIFRTYAQRGYMYPARHIFPIDNVNQTPGPDREKDTETEPENQSLFRSTYSQQHANVPSPSNLTVSSATSGPTGSVAEGSCSSSSISSAPTHSGIRQAKDDPQPPCTLFPNFCATRRRPDIKKASTIPNTAQNTAPNRRKDVAANIARAADTPESLLPSTPADVATGNIWPTSEEAEIMLSEFRNVMMPLFPFVIIPDFVTSEQLRSSRPMLWKSVMMAACQLDGARQMVMGNQLLGELAAAAFLQPRRTLDTLQAALILIGWFHYNINSFQLFNLIYLARAMCVSLSISSEPMPPQAFPQRREPAGAGPGGNEPAAGGAYDNNINAERDNARGPEDGNGNGDGFDSSRQTTHYPPVVLEQMRTFAGTFYLAALATTTSKRPDVMMNTPYLETCCQVIERQIEYPTDTYLLQLVRIQQLSQSISMAHSLRTEGMQMGMSLHHMMQNLRRQLAVFKAQIPEAYSKDVNLVGHLHTAEILLYETAIQETISQPSLGDESLSASDRLELLWACTHAIKDLMLNRFQDHVTDQPRSLCLASLDYMFAFLTALKLMTLQTPGWDGRRVRTELAFDDLIDRQIFDLQMMAERRGQKRICHSPEKIATPAQDWSSVMGGTSVPAASTNESGSGTVLGGSNDNNNSSSSSSYTTGDKDSNGARGAPKNSAQTLADPQDPFTRLVGRLTELKSMISKELDRLPGIGNSAPHPHGFGAGPVDSRGISGTSVMDAAMPAKLGQAPELQNHPDADTEMLPPTAVGNRSDAAARHASMESRVHVEAATAQQQNAQQEAQQSHFSLPDAPQETGLDMPFDTVPINAEPILSFADATIDYMQNMDGSGYPDLLSAPGWESYLDANLATPSFYDSWGSQMNL
ncbi:hypothetical protein SEPCBS57363_003417 [Sporothrix epigloea]|uniref:C6 zinc finger domain containing protein n=1 Tax=Sporothrix epigloea TaxID=1892477 RepID=A0ABP0DLC9_9PEZI